MLYRYRYNLYPSDLKKISDLFRSYTKVVNGDRLRQGCPTVRAKKSQRESYFLCLSLCIYYWQPLLHLLFWLLLGTVLFRFVLLLLWKQRILILNFAVIYFLFCNA